LHRGVEVARCFLAVSAANERHLWERASAYPILPRGAQPAKPASVPWLAVGLLPDRMALLRSRPQLMLELGDLERCVAWALLAELRADPRPGKQT
jgi:hypothetical protein